MSLLSNLQLKISLSILQHWVRIDRVLSLPVLRRELVYSPRRESLCVMHDGNLYMLRKKKKHVCCARSEFLSVVQEENPCVSWKKKTPVCCERRKPQCVVKRENPFVLCKERTHVYCARREFLCVVQGENHCVQHNSTNQSMGQINPWLQMGCLEWAPARLILPP